MCSNKPCPIPRNMVFSEAVTFADGTLTINIPAGSYTNRACYDLVITQTIPDETTINALVVITIGDGTVEYPLLKCCGAQVTAAALRTRTRYRVKVLTNAAGGVFQLQTGVACAPNNALPAIDGTDPAAEGGAANG